MVSVRLVGRNSINRMWRRRRDIEDENVYLSAEVDKLRRLLAASQKRAKFWGKFFSDEIVRLNRQLKELQKVG